MKIIAWNLNHRTQEKIIPDGVGRFLESYAPDVITLNEYVDAPSRKSFYELLKEIGYRYIEVSERPAKNNQILVCSKEPMVRGSLQPPQQDDAARSNFLHVKLPESNLDIVGMRAPAYKSRLEKNTYWQEVAEIALKAKGKRTIFLGDINYDPFVGDSRLVQRVAFSPQPNYYIPNPIGDWSYISTNGHNSSRIDHAIVSEDVEIIEAAYISRWQNMILAGPREQTPLTDHAVLSITIKEPGAQHL